MMIFIQFIVGIFTVCASFVLLYLMATSEIHFRDFTFAKYFGLFAIIASIAFFALTRNEDNEETNPAKEKLKK